MNYKFFVFCPDDEGVITKIINVASKNGAGNYGNYSQVAHITHGEGNWKAEQGAKPFEGVVGKITRSSTARIEMMCPAEKAKSIVKAIKSVHPWERVDIEFIKIEQL
ncbi:hypothetical protein HY947_00865 [Candidatus Gottesmanbacteria bacterium]|nr:hypothetical protein [Candidatus Gottesmanbacteria bacterium]